MEPRLRELRKLAAGYGVQTVYYDVNRRRQRASVETLIGVLRCLGAPVERIEDVPAAIEQRRRELWGRVVEPVQVAWRGEASPFALSLPAALAESKLEIRLRQEGGEKRSTTVELASSPVRKSSQVDGREFVVKTFALPWKLPLGYHDLEIEAASIGAEPVIWRSLVIAAPETCYEGDGTPTKTWGVFAPLYSLRSAENWGAGDFTDLERLWTWINQLGGSFVATLPLLAGFLEDPFEPSPYSPASRLFWNEFYVDVSRAPDLEHCRSARELIGSARSAVEIESLRAKELADYAGLMTHKRRVLELLAEDRFAAEGARRQEIEAFCQRRPQVTEYAAFRAAGRRHGRDWTRWPAPLRHRDVSRPDPHQQTIDIPTDEYDPLDFRYHVYVQWLADQQVGRLVEKTRGEGGLYLDLPLGVNRDGFDTWRQPFVYGMKASGGAPPDAFFTKGQDWGFPPLHPERMRENGYRHLLGFLRHHMAHAGMLRIDHVMMLHRLYWVPLGMRAAEGAYVRYPAEELFAVLCLESHRHQCRLVGENLGTVPAYVNADLHRHRLRRLFVVQYEAEPTSDFQANPPRADCVASLNTHDMPPFAPYWTAADVDDLADLGLFDDTQAQAERDRRAAVRKNLVRLLIENSFLDKSAEADALANPSQEVHDALIRWMAAGKPETVLVNLEDMWQETHRQNTPGTVLERANWCWKATRTLEEIENDKELKERLRIQNPS